MLAAKFNLVLANAIPPVSVGKKVYRLGVTKKVPFTMTAIYGGEVKPKLAWELTLSEGVFTFVMGDIPWEDWERMMAVWFTDTGRKTAEGDVIYSLSDMVVWTNRNLIAPYALIALILLRDAKEDGGLSNDHLSRLSAEPVTDKDVMQAVVKAAKMGLNMNLIAKRFPQHIVEAVETAKKQIEAATEVKTEETTEPAKQEEIKPEEKPKNNFTLVNNELKALTLAGEQILASDAFKSRFSVFPALLEECVGESNADLSWENPKLQSLLVDLSDLEIEAFKLLSGLPDKTITEVTQLEEIKEPIPTVEVKPDNIEDNIEVINTPELVIPNKNGRKPAKQ